jgi:hypothetical protein
MSSGYSDGHGGGTQSADAASAAARSSAADFNRGGRRVVGAVGRRLRVPAVGKPLQQIAQKRVDFRGAADNDPVAVDMLEIGAGLIRRHRRSLYQIPRSKLIAIVPLRLNFPIWTSRQILDKRT